MPKKYDRSDEVESFLYSESGGAWKITGPSVEYFRKLEKKKVTKKQQEAACKELDEIFGFSSK